MQNSLVRKLCAAASSAAALQGLRRIIQKQCAHAVFTRNLPSPFRRHPIFVTPSATLEYLLPSPWCFDAALLRFAAEYVKEDSIVWDIGANVGAFSIAAASIASKGEAFAFDADPYLVALLQRTAMHPRNENLQITAVCTAIGSYDGLATFCIARNGRASSFLESAEGRFTAGGVDVRQTVPINTIDTLRQTLAWPTIIKIDVEGAEMDVLQGGATCIQECRPVILIEVGQDSAQAASDLLKQWGYRLRSGQASNYNEPILDCLTNTIAIPT